jgi:hypothetical protein
MVLATDMGNHGKIFQSFRLMLRRDHCVGLF